MINFNSILSSTIGSPKGTYHYELVQCKPGSVASISSDDCLRILDIATLQPQLQARQAHKEGITCLKSIEANIVSTAGRDSVAKIWDIRTGVHSPVTVLKKG